MKTQIHNKKKRRSQRRRKKDQKSERRKVWKEITEKEREKNIIY